MTLSPENRVLLDRVFRPGFPFDRGLDDDEMNRLLDAARAEGQNQGVDAGRAMGERSEREFPRSESWT